VIWRRAARSFQTDWREKRRETIAENLRSGVCVSQLRPRLDLHSEGAGACVGEKMLVGRVLLSGALGHTPWAATVEAARCVARSTLLRTHGGIRSPPSQSSVAVLAGIPGSCCAGSRLLHASAIGTLACRPAWPRASFGRSAVVLCQRQFRSSIAISASDSLSASPPVPSPTSALAADHPTHSSTTTEQAPSPLPRLSHPIVSRHLLFIASLVFAIVVVGGLTRLTESGLSITEWDLVTGILPPLTEEAWDVELAKYRETPEGRL
jgi:Cytochrome oxidase assembly protein